MSYFDLCYKNVVLLQQCGKCITFVFHVVQFKQKMGPFKSIIKLYIAPGLYAIP